MLSGEIFKGLREAGKGRERSQGRSWAHQKPLLIPMGALEYEWNHRPAPPQRKGTRVLFLRYAVIDFPGGQW